MQVKKFEAPTLQEALETIKRELGPEAVILQTKKHKRGFGLMSKASVEVTAAVSDRSIAKKKVSESALPEQSREAIRRMPAEKQGELYDKMMEKHLARAAQGTRDRVEVGASKRPMTQTRYAEIRDEPPRAAKSVARYGTGGPPAQSRGPAATLPATPPSPAKFAERIAGPDAPAGATAAKIAQPGALPMEVERVDPRSLEIEMKHLKRMIQELKSAQEEASPATGAQALLPGTTLFTSALQEAFEQLVIAGVEKRYALGLAKRVAFELGPERSKNPDQVQDQMAAELMAGVEVRSPLEGIAVAAASASASASAKAGPVVICLVGPTGVGKTTTVAKIASEALLRRNLKVGLINLDSYKVAAFDQLATYAKILNVPFRSASSQEDLAAALADFRPLDLAIVDTTGRSQRDSASLKEMEATLQSIPGARVFLVLSMTTRDADLYDMASRFAVFRPEGLVLSKLDEATMHGALLNIHQRTRLPFLYFTTGQRVPEDIEEATRERVAALILDL